MILSVPLPDWHDILSLARAPDSVVAARPWLRDGDHGLWFSRSALALAALAAAWRDVHGRLPRLWLPAYFCAGSLDPLRRLGVDPHFVAVDRDLRPDWRLDATLPPPDLVLSPHYFGQPADLESAITLCRDTGAALIEDCAHALMPAPGLGEQGEYVLWSPYKLLPLPHGGLLVRRPHARLPIQALAAQGAVRSGVALWLVKRMAQKVGIRRQGGLDDFLADPAPAFMPDTPVAAGGIIAMARSVARSLPDIARRRLDLAHAQTAVLAALPDWSPLFDDLTATPYRLALRCADKNVAVRRFNALCGLGLAVESWPDLDPVVYGNPAGFGAALHLRQTVLFLQVHQGIDPADALARCRLLKD